MSAWIDMSKSVMLRAAKLGIFCVEANPSGISKWVTKQGPGAWASRLSLGQAGAIRTDHHKSPRASNFLDLQVGCNFANLRLVRLTTIASTTRWRRVRTPRPPRSRVAPSRPLVCASDPDFTPRQLQPLRGGHGEMPSAHARNITGH
jgi:hypothetical protein